MKKILIILIIMFLFGCVVESNYNETADVKSSIMKDVFYSLWFKHNVNTYKNYDFSIDKISDYFYIIYVDGNKILYNYRADNMIKLDGN